jgi:hypothetical protein
MLKRHVDAGTTLWPIQSLIADAKMQLWGDDFELVGDTARSEMKTKETYVYSIVKVDTGRYKVMTQSPQTLHL